MGLKFPLLLTALFLLNGGLQSHANSDKKALDPKTLVDQFDKRAASAPPVSGSSRLPGAAATEKPEEEKEKFFPQADAFEVAGEQAAYLGAYQALYGPFGTKSNDREELIRKTSVAIEQCLKGSRQCNETKQIEVLRALAHYNAGLEVKKMILKNQTNREKMRSLEDTSPDEASRPKITNEQLQKSLTAGETYEYETDVSKEKPKPRKVAKTTEFHRSYGLARQQVFQMDENLVKSPELTPEEMKLEDDIFSKEFSTLLATRADAGKDDTSRYYKYVPAKEGSSTDVIAKDKDGNTLIDQEKFQQMKAEHDSPLIREAAEKYFGNDRKDKSIGDSIMKMKLETQKSQRLSEVKYDDIDENDKLSIRDKDALRTARNLNHLFKQKSEEAAKEQGRSPADSAEDGVTTERHTSVVLGAADFDKFLDEIWPPAAKRREREEAEAARAEAAAAKKKNKRNN